MSSIVRFYQCECIDKATGRSFHLSLVGANAEEARDVATAWGFVTGEPQPRRPEPARTNPGVYVERQGRHVEESAVADASRTEDMDRMLRVRNQDCHPVDRHFLLQGLAETAYRLRERRSDALTWCEWACWQWLMQAPILIGAMRTQFPPPGEFVHVSVPKRLVILLEKGGVTERAAQVARACQAIGLKQADCDYLAAKLVRLERASAREAR